MSDTQYQITVDGVGYVFKTAQGALNYQTENGGTSKIITQRATPIRGAWCDCGDSEDGPFYEFNGGCSCGLVKEHKHCTNCGKLTQVG